MRTVSPLIGTLLAATALGCLSAPAFAQTAQGQAAASQADEDRFETVVVTAQRRDENLQTVPIAISAFTLNQLEANDIQETADLVRFTPSMTGGLNTGTGAAVSYFIRGLGSTEQVPSFDVPVATYVDEIYYARQSANNVTLLDVQQIEVLRGPQGTLFGRNTTGGAISITTKKPARERGGYVEASYGSFERAQLKAGLDLPINDSAGTKFNLLRIVDEGYTTSVTTGEKLSGEDTFGMRGALRWEITDAIEWNVAVDWLDQQKTTIGSLAFDPQYVSRTGLRKTECDDDILNVFLNSRRGNCSSIESVGVTSNVAWDIGFADVNFITGWRKVNQDFALDFLGGTGPAGGFTIANSVDNEQFTQEIKIVGETGMFKWVGGLFYLDETNTTDQIDTFGALILGDRRMLNGAEAFALYAQTDIDLTEALTVTVGARWTKETKDVSFIDTVRAAYPAGWVNVSAAPGSRPTDANLRALGIPLSQEQNKVTPRLAVRYQLSEDVMVFASATDGFKSGGWNGRPTTAATATAFGPEFARTYEVGVRSEVLDGRARLNATVYRLEVEQLQLLSGFNLPTGGIAFVTRNAGGLEATGLELEGYFRLMDGLDLFAAASFADRGYVNIPPSNGTGNVPCSSTPEPTNCTTTRDEPVRFPENQFTLGGTWELPIDVMGGRFTLNGAVSHSAEYWTSTYNDTRTSTGVPVGGATPVTALLSLVPETTLVNVGIKWAAEDGGWEAALDCSNCTEEYYLGSSLAGLGYPNDPRRVTFRIRFTR
jgi:iron complex outermembrane receptor protein